jgi:universal stress protein G
MGHRTGIDGQKAFETLFTTGVWKITWIFMMALIAETKENTMYTRIVVPVDLAHSDKLTKVLAVAADLCKHYQAEIYLLAVTTSIPGVVAHNPKEFGEELARFASAQSTALGVEFKSSSALSHDPAVDLSKVLDEQIHELKADLVIMASHVPGFRDYVFASNSGYLASHTNLSVFVVR